MPAWLLLLALTAATAFVLVGPELVITVLGFAAFGFVPYVDPDKFVAGNLPIWTVAFGAAAALVLLTWAAREATARSPTSFRPSIVLALVIALAGYTVLRFGASEPLVHPSTTARLAAFAPAALVGYVLFSQPKALAGLRRVLPLVVAVLAFWAVAYIASSTGHCGPCVDLVQSRSEREGLSGEASRLYTAGQESFLGFALIALAVTLARASPLWIGLAALGVMNVAVQASRGQYIAFSAAVLLLLGWKFRRSGATGKVALVLVTALAVVAIGTSAVGDRALSGYQELQQSSGNAGYRLSLIQEASEGWTMLGDGLAGRTRDLGFNFDLGLPNTLIALGYFGAALQVAVLATAIARGVTAGGTLGLGLAAVLTLVLVGRPSLPFLEYGPSALAYGLAVGAVCALPVRVYAPERQLRQA